MKKTALLPLVAMVTSLTTVAVGSPVYADVTSHHARHSTLTAHYVKPGHHPEANNHSRPVHESSPKGSNSTSSSSQSDPHNHADINHIITQFEQAISKYQKIKTSPAKDQQHGSDGKGKNHTLTDANTSNSSNDATSDTSNQSTDSHSDLSNTTADSNGTNDTNGKSPTVQPAQNATPPTDLPTALAEYRTVTLADQSAQDSLASAVTAYVSALHAAVSASQQSTLVGHRTDAKHALKLLEDALVQQSQVNSDVADLQHAVKDQKPTKVLLQILVDMMTAETDKVTDIQSAAGILQTATTDMNQASSSN